MSSIGGEAAAATTPPPPWREGGIAMPVYVFDNQGGSNVSDAKICKSTFPCCTAYLCAAPAYWCLFGLPWLIWGTVGIKLNSA